ncbi:MULTISPECIES: sensor domain-containing phosphodiesterase [unclassified Caballeronia]|uniref:sensor domain-containing phosphodiesterase n=1 Tax=unclassified Caballeronia TaxID=2646786 RepID=UPI0020297270|nr:MULTISPECIES: sensor domain-containing phosphodiesterase [unclassified Caballeronia]
MIAPPYPLDEDARLSTLRSACILDTPPDSVFDDITRLASDIFEVPISLVTLVDKDRQWFKSRVGMHVTETARETSFCAHAILAREPMVVLDTHHDDRFHDNPLVTGSPFIRFYAGAPLVTHNGHAVGTLCIIGTTPRASFGAQERSHLSALANLIAQRIDTLRSTACRDRVTGLPNLTRFLDDLALRDEQHGVAVHASTQAVLIDVCTLDYINRMVVAIGLESINAVAVETTKRLTDALGPGITLYRIGYARYGLVTEASCTGLGRLVDCITGAFERPLAAGVDLPIDVTPSIGVVRLSDAVNPPDMIAALIFASERARETQTRAVYYDLEMGRHRNRAFILINSFKDALSTNQLRLVYQPRVRLSDGVCVSAEALVRWRHPQLGEISPGEFIPLVENTALVNALTDWVLTAALRQLAMWQSSHPTLRVSVNAVASDLTRDNFVPLVESTLKSCNVGAQRLEIEVTEGSLMRHCDRTALAVGRLREIGVALAIDDFGSGFSNLAQLSHLDVATVKIDQALVRAISVSPRDATIVRTVIRLVHELGYTAVAEGVETAEILGQVKAWGCDEVQGYFTGRPMEADIFSAWLDVEQHVMPL